MPEMRKERAAAAAVNLEGISIETDPVTSGIAKDRRWETQDAAVTIPAGAYSVHVRHTDPTGGQITVNGEALGFNRYYERSSREDLVNRTQDFTPEVVILNPDEKKVTITVSYPSSSNVNPQDL
ncbi:hypothetical protein [Lewinella sp. W8]|uniref:hypothetical protein n=1 Tax=Lewinella sp. W8 TaxID=2528208 RepID=UPI00106807E6|nr:hypothetical protein [Lewinella sp. W8]MTB49823.1 hypothetical protein [Lewinella sp. W8]